MEHIPTTESYLQKVVRIARELDISIDKASITCDAFEVAFSDLTSRQAILGMIEQLDESAVRKGEPSGLIINYGVEVGLEGIRVSRYADEIPPGGLVNKTPPDQACIFLQIKDDFPTQEVLGPLIVNKLPSLAKERCQQFSADEVVCSDSRITESEIPTNLPSEPARAVICLGPIRIKLNERFPFVFAVRSKARRTGARFCLTSLGRKALDANLHLPPWAALQAGTPAFQSTSGLSPPFHSEILGHS